MLGYSFLPGCSSGFPVFHVASSRLRKLSYFILVYCCKNLQSYLLNMEGKAFEYLYSSYNFRITVQLRVLSMSKSNRARETRYLESELPPRFCACALDLHGVGMVATQRKQGLY